MSVNSAQNDDVASKSGDQATLRHSRDITWVSRRPTDAYGKCAFIVNTIASAHRIDVDALRSARRCRAPVAFARQIAMYLAHVSCGLSLTEVGQGFNRDRTTVAHACQRVEDRRDHAETDLALDYLEAAIVEWFGAARNRRERDATASASI